MGSGSDVIMGYKMKGFSGFTDEKFKVCIVFLSSGFTVINNTKVISINTHIKSSSYIGYKTTNDKNPIK